MGHCVFMGFCDVVGQKTQDFLGSCTATFFHSSMLLNTHCSVDCSVTDRMDQITGDVGNYIISRLQALQFNKLTWRFDHINWKQQS